MRRRRPQHCGLCDKLGHNAQTCFRHSTDADRQTHADKLAAEHAEWVSKASEREAKLSKKRSSNAKRFWNSLPWDDPRKVKQRAASRKGLKTFWSDPIRAGIAREKMRIKALERWADPEQRKLAQERCAKMRKLKKAKARRRTRTGTGSD
jgi:hypothetical protein